MLIHLKFTSHVMEMGHINEQNFDFWQIFQIIIFSAAPLQLSLSKGFPQTTL